MKSIHTINQVIDEALVGVRDFDRVYYKEAAVYFLRGFRQFNLFQNTAAVKTAWRSISAINTVPFPEDLLRLVRVGVIVNGELWSFTRSENLVDPITDPLDLSLDSDRGEDDTIERSPMWGYNAKGNNPEYYYKEDRKNRRIILSRMAIDTTIFADRSEVYIEYISNGIEDYNTTYILDDAANLLSAYVEMKLVESMPDKYNMNYIMLKKQNYIEEEKRYDALNLPSLQELEDMLYETSGQGVKR